MCEETGEKKPTVGGDYRDGRKNEIPLEGKDIGQAARVRHNAAEVTRGKRGGKSNTANWGTRRRNGKTNFRWVGGVYGKKEPKTSTITTRCA